MQYIQTIDRTPTDYEKVSVTTQTVGRLTEVKGISYLINSMPCILKEFPETKLLIVGKGELEIELQHQVESLNLEKNIVFAGAVPNKDLVSYYASADIFIGPSIQTSNGEKEGFGITFVEAAMCGCLLIASNVGGIRDIIENNKTGFLVSERNSKEIADKVIYSLKNRPETEVIVQKSREKCIAEFDCSAVASRYASLLKKSIY